MSIQKAFEILTETLGENFEFKDDFERFAKTVTSSLSARKAFAECVLKLYPNAKYVYFKSYYDPINRMNRLTGEYTINSSDNTLLDTEDSIRERKPKIHSTLFGYLWDNIIPELMVYDDLDGEEFRFDLHTLDCWHHEDYEEETPILTQYELKLSEFADFIRSLNLDAAYIDFFVHIDSNDYSHYLGNYEIISSDGSLITNNEILHNSDLNRHIVNFLNEFLVDDVFVTDFGNGTEFRFDLYTLVNSPVEYKDDEN